MALKSLEREVGFPWPMAKKNIAGGGNSLHEVGRDSNACLSRDMGYV